MNHPATRGLPVAYLLLGLLFTYWFLRTLPGGVARTLVLAGGGCLFLLLLSSHLLAPAPRGGASLPGFAFLGFLFRRKPKPAKEGARWATVGELRRAGWLTKEGGWPLGELRSWGGLVRHIVYLPPDRQPQNTIVLAPNGQGKTKSLLLPAILAEALIARALRRSNIIVDPKGDLYAETHEILSRTHRIERWIPSRPALCTCRIDPLLWVPGPDDERFIGACETAAQIVLTSLRQAESGGRIDVGDSYWVTQPANILKGLVSLVRSDYPTAGFIEVVDELATTTLEDLHTKMTASGKKATRMRGSVVSQLTKSEKTQAGVLTELIDRLVLFSDERVAAAMTEKPAFDLDRFLAEPTVLYLQVNGLTDTLGPLLSVALSSISNELVRRCEDTGRLSREVRVFVDELAALGRIYRLPTNLATFRSYGVGHFLVSQDRPAVRTLYGHDNLNSILSNCVTTIALGGMVDEDAEWIARRVSTQATVTEMPSYGPGGHKSTHYQMGQAPLITAEELRHMVWEMVVDSSQIHPMRLGMRHYKSYDWTPPKDDAITS